MVPGSGGSTPQNIALAGNHLFFDAWQLATGRELWAIELPPVCTNATVNVSPRFANYSSTSTGGTITVSTLTNCTWTASAAGGSFVSITAGSSGSGNGTVSYQVLQNSTATARSTSMAVAGVSVTITQSAASVVPSVLTATGAAAQVDVSWTPVGGATSYQVWRSAHNGAFTLRGSTSSLAMTDSSVIASTSYVYRVQAHGPLGVIAYSNVDLATVFNFTDAIEQEVTTIRSVHVSHLRQAINAARIAVGRAAIGFTDPTLAGILVKRVHVIEMRNEVSAIRAAVGLPPIAYTDPAITTGLTTPKAAHMNELRAGLR
jgi:hypothetical protein